MEYEELNAEERERLAFISQQKARVLKNIEALKLELHNITSQIESLGFSVDGEDPSIRRLTLGCKKFNNNAKQGLEYLTEQGFIEQTPESIAQFFVDHSDNLSKCAIGAYIGEVRKDFNMRVLDAFTKAHDFKDQDFLPALRRFLLSFQLPGESQKIDRILTSFCGRYIDQNQSVFTSSHEAYLLAYAVVLLNTTLHNTNAKCQTTGLADEKTFIRTLVEETKLNEDFLRKIYHAIKSEPLRVATDDGLVNGQTNAIMKGWLWKLGGRVKSWKRRWFLLTEDSLLYYLTPERARQTKGVINLDGICVRVIHDKAKEHTFELFCSRNELIKSCKMDREWVPVPGHHTVYRMAAPSATERDEWIRMLERVTNQLAERRATRSVSMDCSSSSTGTIQSNHHFHHHLPAPVSSLSFKHNASSTSNGVGSTTGSQPDLPSQQSVLN